MIVSVTNPGAIDDEYIERFCVPKGKKKSGGESFSPAREAGGPSGGTIKVMIRGTRKFETITGT